MMYHRLVTGTGLGNPSKCIMSNEWVKDNKQANRLIKQMLSEAVRNWFSEYDGLDFNIEMTKDYVKVLFGVEPSYQMDKLITFCISTTKEESYKSNGIAYGYYGSDIVKQTKAYSEYKNKCKFTRFVDKWAKQLEALKSV